MNGQRQGAFAVRRQGETVRIGDKAGVDDLAITAYLKAQCGILGQIDEVHIVVQCEHAGFPVILHNAHRAIDILEFQQPGVRAAVRVDQTVHAEVTVVRPFVMVTAVVVDAAAVECLSFINAVVAPLPQEAADQTVMALDELEVILQIAGAVAHTMAVLAHDIGLVRVVVQIFLNAFERGVHIAEHINVREIVFAGLAAVLGALVVGQAAGVKALCPCQCFLKRAAIGALVAHRPDDDAGTVLVALHAAAGAVYGGLGELRVIRDGFVPVLDVVGPAFVALAIVFGRTVALVVGFINNKEAVLVAELIEVRHIWVMAGADGIEVVLFNHEQIFFCLLKTNGIASDRVGFVAVYAVELDGLAVDINLIVGNVNLTDAYTVCNGLAGGVQYKGI